MKQGFNEILLIDNANVAEIFKPWSTDNVRKKLSK